MGRKKADIIPGYPNSLNWILQYAVDLQWRQLPPFIQKWESSKYNATRSIFPGNSWIIWIERRNQNEIFTSRITTKSTQLHGYGFRAEASGTIHFNFTSFFQQSWPNNLGKKKIYYMAKRTFLSLDQRGKSACARKVYLAHLDIVNQYTRFA